MSDGGAFGVMQRLEIMLQQRKPGTGGAGVELRIGAGGEPYRGLIDGKVVFEAWANPEAEWAIRDTFRNRCLALYGVEPTDRGEGVLRVVVPDTDIERQHAELSQRLAARREART